eukprot:COSAG02_NODE_8425_length_2575_cov_4.168821_3_plen_183_part_00
MDLLDYFFYLNSRFGSKTPGPGLRTAWGYNICINSRRSGAGAAVNCPPLHRPAPPPPPPAWPTTPHRRPVATDRGRRGPSAHGHMAPIALSFRPSGRRGKKLAATFLLSSGATRTVHFGQRGAEDFTTHQDRARKRHYLARHAPREDWDDPLTAGALSRWILWHKTSRPAAVAAFRRRFNLQ